MLILKIFCSHVDSNFILGSPRHFHQLICISLFKSVIFHLCITAFINVREEILQKLNRFSTLYFTMLENNNNNHV